MSLHYETVDVIVYMYEDSELILHSLYSRMRIYHAIQNENENEN